MKINSVKIITVLSILASGLWILGLGVMVQDQFFHQATPLPPKVATEAKTNDRTLHLVALGDSLTRGTGDETGKGYVGYLVDELRTKTKQPLQLTNLAIKGLRSAELVQQLRQPEVERQLKQADFVFMTIGGNDLFQGGEALRNLSFARIQQTKAMYLRNLETIFRTIRAVNPHAVVFYISLYNPFKQLNNGKTTSEIVRQWNYDSAEVAARYPNIIAVPTYDLFELHVNEYLYSDQFHPNKEGYKLIGERVASLITFTKGGEK
ncbi:SGNH/GDSL hydrolase family protein [Anoxybacillus sp. J5B_2022]|uniref:SGNH/GDSL hydrolase family protein n=1 Tax=Anoxybacillus sp. J5B_2022 TaxID=3003246 RepID=UPI002286A3FA|nr:SGNH/GDSL hydrolase family protein [Anoxybacillus sp. J5B_2022]MCZ0755909.1 SGNH/GDSL hydrolase family protein [Anoxybacillus sp. J5B_2022]